MIHGLAARALISIRGFSWLWPIPTEPDKMNAKSARLTFRSIQLLQHPGGVSHPANDEWATGIWDNGEHS
jgi:hypothetical protein